MLDAITVSKRISYLDCKNSPLSSNVGIVRGDSRIWLYDVGNGKDYADYISALSLPVSAVLSHFHPDHTANINDITVCELYVSKNTVNHVNKGTVISAPVSYDDGVHIEILPIPSFHAKGSLALSVDKQYLFTGDALYMSSVKGAPCYNAGILREQISFLKNYPDRFILQSHKTPFVEDKSTVIDNLTDILKKEEKGNPYIFLSEFQ